MLSDESLLRRIEELEALVYVPGLWRCTKCDFQLIQANMSAHSGTVTARDEPGDKCPNCDSPLWRVTERQAGNNLIDRMEPMQEELTSLRAEASRLQEEINNSVECVAAFMLSNSYATGHGDDVGALVTELAWQHKERLERLRQAQEKNDDR
jgi:hypothetical protein